jgi:hypothetical protein
MGHVVWMMIVQMTFNHLWRNPMENSPIGQTSPKPQNSNENTSNKQAMLREICAKWSKFSEQDASALKSNDDLVTQVVAKYGTEQAQAKREVDALLKGRQVGQAGAGA